MVNVKAGANVSAEVETQVWRQLVASFKSGVELSPSEKARIQRSMGWSRADFAKAERVAERIARQQAQAGSEQERVNLATVAVEAAEKRKQREPEIVEEIQKLERERRSLEQSETQAARRLDDAILALNELRKRVPSCVTELVSFERDLVESEYGDVVREMEIEIRHIETLIDPSLHRDKWHHVDAVERYDSQYVDSRESGRYRQTKLSDAWPAHRQELEDSLPALREQLAAAQQAYDDAMQKAEQPLAFWELDSE